MAKEIPIKLKAGDKAPDFCAASQSGVIKLADLKGKYVVLYFYPKDNTPGCTKEACGFRDFQSEFQKRNATILGVSVDSLKSHEKFISKFQLPFPLLVDEDKKIVNAYGVWGLKKFMGREYEGVFRVTFLIDPKGKIAQVWPEVKPETHAKEILDYLDALK